MLMVITMIVSLFSVIEVGYNDDRQFILCH